jgi:hypothetical protein
MFGRCFFVFSIIVVSGATAADRGYRRLVETVVDRIALPSLDQLSVQCPLWLKWLVCGSDLSAWKCCGSLGHAVKHLSRQCFSVRCICSFIWSIGGALIVAGGDGTMKLLYTPALELVEIATGSDIAAWDNRIEAVA